MFRFATLSMMLLVACCLGGCANMKTATYSCRAAISHRIDPGEAISPHKDSGGDYTCE